MTVDRSPARPEDVIREAIGMMELGHGDYARATEALAVLLAERQEREAEWKEAWMMRLEQYHAAVARAVRAEQERDEWRAKFEHSDNRTHANGPTAIERALRAEARVRVLEEAFRDVEKHAERYPGVGIAEWVRHCARTALAATTAPPQGEV